MMRFYVPFSLRAAASAGQPAARRAGHWLLGLLLLLLSAPAAHATHIVGGEMDLQYLSGNTYQLSLNLYFDAVNGSPGALDADLTAGIFDKANDRQMQTVVLRLISNDFVNYTNPACTVGSLSTRQLLYRNTIELPPGTYSGAQGYYAAVERCCRNITISNIVAPANSAQTFYLEFPAVVRNGQTFRDSTPRIFPPLADYACLNETFYYDFAGKDPDGDSLAYDLVTPLNGHANSTLPKPAPQAGPYAPINWYTPQGVGVIPYSVNYQIAGSPTLTVNALTGRLTVRPTKTGLFVFGVRCQEYRKGLKLGETRRDFQLQVLVCAQNAAPSLVMLPGINGSAPYRPGIDTLRIVPGGQHCVRVRFTDPDPSSQLTLSLQPVNYAGTLPTFTTSTTGTVHTAGQPDTLVASLCFSDCIDTKGKVGRINLIVADNGCSLPKHDTIHVAFIATPAPNGLPSITSTAGPTLPLHVKPGQTLAFDLVATDPDSDPLLFTLAGSPAGFAPDVLGATITTQAQVGTQRRARFSWPVDCRAVTTPPGQTQQLIFGATATTPCGERQVAPTLSIPVIVDYSNAPPVLTSTLPADSAGNAPIVRMLLGAPYSATLAGTDTDKDVLVLSATGDGFNLADVGMRFTAPAGAAGQAAGTFNWLPTCDGGTVVAGEARQFKVTFQLQEATCRPLPQTRTVVFEVAKKAEPPFTPPNIITPNGDRLNDFFTLALLPADFCDLRFADIKIFSRWGKQVFASSDREFRWYGENAAGTYYYLVTYTTGKRYKGWVEVIP